MKSIGRTLLVVLLVVLVGVLGILIYGNQTENRRLADEEQKALEAAMASPAPTPKPGFVEPENAADATLAFLGDLMCHTGINDEAKQDDGSYDYKPIFGDAGELVAGADLAFCTLSTTLTDSGDYTGYPLFKSPVELASGLKDTGFDVINTATDHCMDAGQEGLNFTLSVLDTHGLSHVGTYSSQEERTENDGILVKEVNGISFAVVSYTYSPGEDANIDDFDYAANLLYADYDTDREEIDKIGLSLAMESARNLETDMIIVMCQWGNEYDAVPTTDQKELADFFFEEGADIIIGGHTQSAQPMELRIIKDEDGTDRVGLLAYSLGNFITAQSEQNSNFTAAVSVAVQKDLDTGKAYLRTVSYTPLVMCDLNAYEISYGWRFKLRNLESLVAAYAENPERETINEAMNTDLTAGLEHIRSVFGEDMDTAAGGVDAAKWYFDNN